MYLNQTLTLTPTIVVEWLATVHSAASTSLAWARFLSGSMSVLPTEFTLTLAQTLA